MPSVIRISAQGKAKALGHTEAANEGNLTDLAAMIPLTKPLLPLGLQPFAEVMKAEVAALAGVRYSRTGGQPGLVRWGRQRGSIFLADEKVPVAVQRIRDRLHDAEIPLRSYQQLQAPRQADAGLFRKVLLGLSCRDYRGSAGAGPGGVRLRASSVSP